MAGCSTPKETVQYKFASMQNERTIDNYLYQGVKMFVYDTTVVVMKETGDTLRTDRSTTRSLAQETIIKTDTVYISKTDTIQAETQYIVKREMNGLQKTFFYIGIIAVSMLAVYIIRKIKMGIIL